jgi:hypothetical protein
LLLMWKREMSVPTGRGCGRDHELRDLDEMKGTRNFR